MSPPMYRVIRTELEGRIHSGELVPGDRLPTEQQLREQYEVSRATAQRVLNDLAASGLVVRRRRHGTFVADAIPQVDLLAFVAPDLIGRTSAGRHVVLSARIVSAGAAMYSLPGVQPSTAVIELVRLKLDPEDRPRQVERHVILFSAAPDVLDQELEHFVSLRHFNDLGVELSSVRVYLDPVALSEDDADLLDSEPGTPTLVRRREALAPDGTAVEVMHTVIRPGSVRFFVELPPGHSLPRGNEA
ncbi:GntR family transcriptional regulator [Actinosynnema sp. ALI-1.44]|nr:GntR family transcriptional regulator [Actinosynnema sp. ALI-1.44]